MAQRRPPGAPTLAAPDKPALRCSQGISPSFNPMQSSSRGSWSKTLDSLVNGVVGEIPASEIFVQTPQGVLVAATMPAHLPDRLRMLLFLINGRRRMSEYRDLLPRYRNLDDAFDMLVKKGFIERLADRSGH